MVCQERKKGEDWCVPRKRNQSILSKKRKKKLKGGTLCEKGKCCKSLVAEKRVRNHPPHKKRLLAERKKGKKKKGFSGFNEGTNWSGNYAGKKLGVKWGW